jgi:hypothetical protein
LAVVGSQSLWILAAAVTVLAGAARQRDGKRP